MTGDSCSCRTPTSSTTPRTGRKLLAPVLRGQGARRLRLALHRRAPQHAVPALGRQPLPVAHHQRALQHDALRHGDLLQAHRPCAARRHHAARRCASTSSPRSRRRSCKRKVRIYEVPISYTGREFDEGKKITWRDGFVGAVDAREVPLPRLVASVVALPDRARWAAVVVNYEAGTLLTECVASVLADDARRAGRARRRRQRLARRSVDALQRARSRRARGAARRATSGTRGAANLGIAATRAPTSSRCSTPTSCWRRAPPRRSSRRLDAEPELAACRAARCRTSTAPTTRRRARIPSTVDRGQARRCSVCRGPTNRVHAPLPPARRRRRTGPARRRLGVGRGRLAAARRARRRRRMGRALLHVHGGRRSVLAAAAVRAGTSRTSRPGVVLHVQGASTARRPYRMLAEHHRSAWRFARRRFTGCAALLLPFAAVYLAVRAAPGDGRARLGRVGDTRRAPASLRTPWARPLARSDAATVRSAREVPRQPRMVGAGGRRHRSSGRGRNHDEPRPRTPTRRPVANKDHWHAASASTSAASGCRTRPTFEDRTNVGIHTHGDGLIHIHPFLSRGAATTRPSAGTSSSAAGAPTPTRSSCGTSTEHKTGDKCGDKSAPCAGK